MGERTGTICRMSCGKRSCDIHDSIYHLMWHGTQNMISPYQMNIIVNIAAMCVMAIMWLSFDHCLTHHLCPVYVEAGQD